MEHAQETPARLSSTALLAIGCVVLAVVSGCGGGLLTAGAAMGLGVGAVWGMYGVWAAPLVALAGVVLGLLGLRSIRLGEGEVVGRPMALVGVFVGLAITALLGAVALSSLAMLAGPRALAPESARLLLASSEGRFADARGALGESANSNLTNDELAAFAEAVAAKVGPIRGAAADLSLIGAGREVIGQTPGAAGADLTVEEMPRPVWVLGETGRTLLYVWPDDRALRENDVRIKDALVVLGPNRVATLRFPGPAQTLAIKVGWETQHELPSLNAGNDDASD